jgi:hypothetical protein
MRCGALMWRVRIRQWPRNQESIKTMPRHGPGKFCPLAMGSLLAAIASGVLLAADSDRSLPAVSEQARAEHLVAQLGAASYERREQAAHSLQEIGAAALPSLRSAIAHSDLEIRYRAQDLLERIELVEQTRVLREFLSSGDPALGELLHGWKRFARLVGHDLSARALFAHMHQEEPEIMRLCDRSGPELSNLIEERSLQFRSSSQRAATAGMSPATLAVFLFIMLDPQTELSGGANSLMSVVLRQSQISDMLSEEGNSAFRRLMTRWIADADEVPPSQRVHVAVTYSLETGVVPALELIRSQARGSQIQNAIFAIAKLGGPDHLADLEPLLVDDSVLAEHQQGNAARHLPSQVREVARHLAEFEAQQYVDAMHADAPDAEEVAYSSLVCDVALVAMLHLTGQNPHDYGFTKLRPNKYFYEHNTAGFDSQQQRARALSQWRLWCKVQRLQSREIDETAVEGVQL